MYRMNVATALDDNYAKYTYVMLYSLFTNNEDAEIYVYLLQNSLTEESIQNLEKLCDTYRNHLCLLDVNEDTMDQRLLQTDNWTMETCYRLQLFDILPSEVDRLLYLDVDMVINQSVSENLGGIGAVIAHEISHAFDNNGSHFDENGNLFDWWCEEDFEAFKKLMFLCLTRCLCLFKIILS